MKRINQKGFSLVEVLIVVAIIGILVAVSIPMYTKQLAKARFETNRANARAAYACAMAVAIDEHNASGAYYLMKAGATCTPAWHTGVAPTGELSITGTPNDWELENYPDLGKYVYDDSIAVIFDDGPYALRFELSRANN